jgi:hypothetical protein
LRDLLKQFPDGTFEGLRWTPKVGQILAVA